MTSSLLAQFLPPLYLIHVRGQVQKYYRPSQDAPHPPPPFPEKNLRKGGLQVPQVAASGARARPGRLLAPPPEAVGGLRGQARFEARGELRRHPRLDVQSRRGHVRPSGRSVGPDLADLAHPAAVIERGVAPPSLPHVLAGALLAPDGGGLGAVRLEVARRELRTGVAHVLAGDLLATGGGLGAVRLEVAGREHRAGVAHVLAGHGAPQDGGRRRGGSAGDVPRRGGECRGDGE